MSHGDHDHSDDEIRDLLRLGGLRATPQRRAVLHAFHHADGQHLSAEDVLRHPEVVEAGIDRSTIYRAVASLVDSGLLKEVRFHDGVARFEIQRRHHHHAVCTRCGATVDVADDAMHQLARRLARDEGFTLSSEPQLLAGLCSSCRS